MMHEGYGFGFGFGGIFMWLFWILVIVAIVWAIRGFSGGGDQGRGERKSAREILEERYARGEIDQQEFEQKKQDLSR